MHVIAIMFFKKLIADYFFMGIVSFVQVLLLILSFFASYSATGSFIQQPTQNWMIGPSTEILIQMGSRFAPCMKPTNNTVVQCFNGKLCSLQDLCSKYSTFFGTKHDDQWGRFVVPIFLHGGIIHAAVNIFVQLTSFNDVLVKWRWYRIFVVYFLSGIFGFALGAAFGPQTQGTHILT